MGIGLLLTLLIAKAESDTLCKPDEAVVFNCFTGKKTASLCAAPTASAPSVLTYRYGTAQRVENEYVATASNGRSFGASVAPAAPRAWVSQVWFDRSDYRYVMTECVGGDCPSRAGLAVFRGERLAMKAACQRPEGGRLPAFSRELIQFGSDTSDIHSSSPLIRIEDVDNGAYDLYKPVR